MQAIRLSIYMLVLALLGCTAWGQSIQVDLGSASASAGAVVQVPVFLISSGGAQPAGIQLDLSFNASILTFNSASAGPAASAAGKSAVSHSSTPGALRVIVFGMNQNVMADGTIAWIEFKIAAAAVASIQPVSVTAASASTPLGQNIPVSFSGGNLIVQGGIVNPKELFFSQVADGGGYYTNFILVNPGSQEIVALLELFKPDGTALHFHLNGNVDNVFAVPIKAKGMASLRSANTGAATQVGWARVRCAQAVGGSIIYAAVAAGGSVLEEAGLDPSSPTSSFFLSVDTRRGSLAGLAVANPNSATANLTLSLYDQAGFLLNQRTESLAGGGQWARMVEQLFPAQATALSSFTGTIQVSAVGATVFGTTLRFTGNLSVFASIPVITAGSGSEISDLYFPQIADGGGYRTTLTLVNPTDSAISATLETFQGNGTPLIMTLNGTAAASRPLTIPAKGVALLESANLGGVVAGWARVRGATGRLGGSIVYGYLSNGSLVSEAGIDPARKTAGFSLSVDTRNGYLSGVAIANPDDSLSRTYRLSLYDAQGVQVGTMKTLILGPHQHTAQMVEQLFSLSSLKDFTGIMTVHAEEGTVIGTTLRFTSDLSVFASIPVIY